MIAISGYLLGRTELCFVPHPALKPNSLGLPCIKKAPLFHPEQDLLNKHQRRSETLAEFLHFGPAACAERDTPGIKADVLGAL